MKPKGKILLIGGAEDKGGNDTPEIESRNKEFVHYEILRSLLPENKHGLRIEVITTASSSPEEVEQSYQPVFRKIGFRNVGFMHITSREEAYLEQYRERLKKANVVFFTGGDQFRLSTIIAGTELCSIIYDRYLHMPDFVIAGTSAGAMAISSIMIQDGDSESVLIDSSLHTCSGLGFLNNCIVDTHFIRRGRFGRLTHAVIINPGQLGIGLEEDTSLVITEGKFATCHGSGMAVVIDGTCIGQSNISEAGEGEPVYVENLNVHVLVKDCRLSLEDRRMLKPARKKNDS